LKAVKKLLILCLPVLILSACEQGGNKKPE
jgi:hypothetical protein